MKKTIVVLSCIFFLAGCTFNYGGSDSSGDQLPDLIMTNVEYVRIRSADPLARIQAERVERYEKQNLIKLQAFIFEQYGEKGEEVYIYGRAQNATVEIESQDIFMEKGVWLEVKTEDIIMETYQLEWKDETRSLSAGENNEVYIYRSNGTRFTGISLNADARRRTWEFRGLVTGTYIHEDDEEEE